MNIDPEPQHGRLDPNCKPYSKVDPTPHKKISRASPKANLNFNSKLALNHPNPNPIPNPEASHNTILWPDF